MRTTSIPTANNPRLLFRMLGWVARGVRTSRGLQEALGVDVRTVQYYLQAAQWLRLMEAGSDHLLTAAGLDVVFGGDPLVSYSKTVRQHPFIEALVSEDEQLPAVEDVVVAIARAEPDLAPATVRRKASAVRSLVQPALASQARAVQVNEQLLLPLSAPAVAPLSALNPGRAKDADPDVFRWIYEALLDYGELTLGHLRGLLDRAGVSELPIGGYIDLLIQRGDATRVGERLVVTAGGVARREAASSTTGIILSHAGYRGWLDDMRDAATGDRSAEIRMSEVARTFREWDIRLFGGPANPDTVDRMLDRVLLDRSLDSFPISGPPGEPLASPQASFLDCWQEQGLVLTLPPFLSDLFHGVAGVNRVLAAGRSGDVGVGSPSLAFRPTVAHGGVLHPGEPLPKSVPDTVSLRQRLLMNAPYPAIIAALLLLHRREPGAFSVESRAGMWFVSYRGKPVGKLLSMVDSFGASRGWLPCRRRVGGLAAADVLDAMDALGVVHVLGDIVVLSEVVFHRFRAEPEDVEVYEALRPLADVLETWLHEVRPVGWDA